MAHIVEDKPFNVKKYTKSLPVVLLGIVFISVFVLSQQTKNQITTRSKAALIGSLTPAPIPWRSSAVLIANGEIPPPQPVLEVNLFYALSNQQTTPVSVTISRLKILNGYPTRSEGGGSIQDTSTQSNVQGLTTKNNAFQPIQPQPSPGEGTITPIPPETTVTPLPQETPILTAQLLDSSGRIVSSVAFIIPSKTDYETSIHPVQGGEKEITSGGYSLQLPWREEATEIRIVDTKNDAVSQQAIGTPETDITAPNFFEVRGDQISTTIELTPPVGTPILPHGNATISKSPQVKGVASQKLDGTITSPSAPNTRVDSIHILVIGDGYSSSELDLFHQQVGDIARQFVTVEPFKTRHLQI